MRRAAATGCERAHRSEALIYVGFAGLCTHRYFDGMALGDFRYAVALLAAGVSFSSNTASAELFEAGPSDDVESMINALGPGDELVLEGGMYTLTERFSFAIAGTESEPIVVRASPRRQHGHHQREPKNRRLTE